MVNHISIWQIALVVVPLVGFSIYSRRTASPLQTNCWLALSSIYLLIVIIGRHHLVTGYWAYSAGLMFVCTGRAVDVGLKWIWGAVDTSNLWRRLLAIAAALGLCLSLVPGSGLNTLYVHLLHWNDIEYNAPRFGKALALSLPADSVYAVDVQFMLDFLVNDRKAVLIPTIPAYFRVEQYPFDYLIVSRYGMETQIAKRLPVKLLRTEGIKDDEFACYCELYVP